MLTTTPRRNPASKSNRSDAREAATAPENGRGRPWRIGRWDDASQGRKGRQRANLGLVIGRGGRRGAVQRASEARRPITPAPEAQRLASEWMPTTPSPRIRVAHHRQPACAFVY
jgi:hypothetical protein